MHNIIGKRSQRWIAGGVLMVFAGLSHAQYLWLNEKGAKVYSDRPPPASVPTKNILKSPAALRRAVEEGSETPVATGETATAAPKGPPTLADRNAESRKRAAEKAELEQKNVLSEAQKTAKKLNCDNARNYKRILESGERIGTMEQNGERGFMSDGKRAEAASRANKIIEDCP